MRGFAFDSSAPVSGSEAGSCEKVMTKRNSLTVGNSPDELRSVSA